MREIARAPGGREALAQVVRYILEVAEQIKESELRALLERALAPDAKGTIMTLAEQYIEKGRQEGRLEILLRLVRKRFGPAVDATLEARIAQAPGEQVEAWADRVLSAATLDEVFAD